MRRNPHNFRVFSPDENASNRLTAIYEATKKIGLANTSQKMPTEESLHRADE